MHLDFQNLINSPLRPKKILALSSYGSRAAALRGTVQQTQAGDILGPRVPGACVGTRVNTQTVRRQLLRIRIAPHKP
jgi:hypothetical protein